MDRKIAFVTGSTKGIMATANALMEKGYHVIILGRNNKLKNEEIIKKFERRSTAWEYKKCDISSKENRVHIFNRISQEFGRLDVLVNNAGVALLERLDILETTTQNYDRVINVNLKGTFFMCQEAAKIMKTSLMNKLEDHKQRIINIASVSQYASSTNRPEYCISKAGISMVTSLFADRLSEEGIRVFEIRPGIIMTDMTAGVKEEYENLISEGLTPLKKLGQPEDVAKMVVAACSGLLDFTTGQILNADGGFHLRRL